jgi:aspartate/methionine/tyrosine aminotransferase
LADSGVLIAPGDCFGRPAHVRIGFAQQADDFDVALGTIRDRLSIEIPA